MNETVKKQQSTTLQEKRENKICGGFFFSFMSFLLLFGSVRTKKNDMDNITFLFSLHFQLRTFSSMKMYSKVKFNVRIGGRIAQRTNITR